MGARHPDSRRAKVHRTYTLVELASLLDVHPNTVRNWRRDGLAPVDDRRPALFRGAEVRVFLAARRANGKRPCGPGQIFCLPCRSPKEPAGRMADYQPQTSTSGKLVGLCPDCGRLIYRRVSVGQLAVIAADLDLQLTQGDLGLDEGR